MAGASAWIASDTITRAIEVREGVVLNPAILEFQGREAASPHRVEASAR
jgi:alanine dehydrogenase